VPRKNPIGFSAFDAIQDLIEDGAAGSFGRHGFGKFAGNRKIFFQSERAQFRKLGINGQNLFFFGIGRLARTKRISSFRAPSQIAH
jgi:hypothetical protein